VSRARRGVVAGSSLSARPVLWQDRGVRPTRGLVCLALAAAGCGRVGYDGDCIIEHEDRRFEGTDALVKRGFLLARNILRPYIPKES